MMYETHGCNKQFVSNIKYFILQSNLFLMSFFVPNFFLFLNNHAKNPGTPIYFLFLYYILF